MFYLLSKIVFYSDELDLYKNDKLKKLFNNIFIFIFVIKVTINIL